MMNSEGNLKKNSEVLVFFADGFEEIESIGAVDILRRGGLDVATVFFFPLLIVSRSVFFDTSEYVFPAGIFCSITVPFAFLLYFVWKRTVKPSSFNFFRFSTAAFFSNPT